MAEKEYIEREAIKSKKIYSEERHEYVVPVAEIDWMTSADVAPVKHAKWAYGKLHGQSGYYCSECGTGFADINPNAELIAKSHNYCPNCGAKMDMDWGGNNDPT